ncbi:hypothetical protein Tco_1071473, partial [Tanacetum coccineum]
RASMAVAVVEGKTVNVVGGEERRKRPRSFDPNNTGQKLNEGWESVNYKRPSRNVVSPQKIRHRMMILMERLMKWMKIVRMIGNFIIQKNVLSRMDAVLAGMVSNILA